MHSSYDRQFVCLFLFFILAVVDNAAVNMEEQISL